MGLLVSVLWLSLCGRLLARLLGLLSVRLWIRLWLCSAGNHRRVRASAQTAPVVVERANPVSREYDQYGQEVKPAGAATGSPPLYLFAFRDNVIRAAAAYWVDGQTLHYVTVQHEEKQAPLDSLDRALTLQLNRERRVPVQLP